MKQQIRSLMPYLVLLLIPLLVLGSSVLAQDEPVVLDWINDAPWHQPGQDALGDAALEAINIDINTVMFSSTDAFQASVRGALPTESAFPLFDWWFAYRMKDLVDAGLLADVTDIWQRHIDAGEYPASLMNSFGFDGRAYALPKLINYWIVFYNQRVFDEYGLEVPTTWDELIAVAETLKSGGVTPFGQDVVGCRWCSFIWFEELLVRTDPALYQSLMTGETAYNDPQVVAVMEQWRAMIDAGYFSQPGEIDFDTSADSFANGDFAMLLMGDWWTANIERAGLTAGDDYGVFVMPGITEAGSRSLIIEGRPVLIAEHSPQRDAALEFADYFMGVEGQTIWATTGQVNSPNLLVAEETRPAHLVDLANAVADGDYDLYTRYWEATPPEIVEAVVDLLGQFAIDPTSLQASLDGAQQIAEDYWASAGSGS
jgi:multiple sugar transport system substrate-binding protein